MSLRKRPATLTNVRPLWLETWLLASLFVRLSGLFLSVPSDLALDVDGKEARNPYQQQASLVRKTSSNCLLNVLLEFPPWASL